MQIPASDWMTIVRWKIAEETGWTLEYIDSLPYEAIYQWLSLRDGNAKAQKVAAQKARASASVGGRKRGRR